MKIVVLIKQVPETNNVKMDAATGTMIRDGVEAIVNPLDLYAVETALQLRQSRGGTVTALTMGPPKSEKALREVVAMGCDDALQLSDRAFAGSDTWATSYILAEAIRSRLEGFDLILCGERATDGDTGQVGPAVASFLDLPLATYVSAITDVGDGIGVRRLVEGGYEKLRLPLPALLTVVKEISFPRLPTLGGKRRARQMAVERLGRKELALDEEDIGLGGSPTRVSGIFTPQVARRGRKVVVKDEGDLDRALKELMDFLDERHLLPVPEGKGQ